jgi:hypothetical protein
MKKEQESDFEFISKYYDLELTKEEVLLFEKKIKEDAFFAEKVSVYKKSIEIVEEIDPNSEDNIRKREWKNIIRSKKQTKTVQWKKIIRIAASFIIAFSVIYYFVFDTNDATNQIEKAWSKNVGLDFVYRSTIDSTTFSLSEALEKYKNKEYKGVLAILKEYDSTSSDYKSVLVLKSLAYHRLHDSEKALKTLDTLDIFSPNISKWYKGLIYLENSDLEKAKSYLVVPNNYQEEIKLKR